MSLKRLVELMFYWSALAITPLMLFISYAPIARTYKIYIIFNDLFYLLLGFLIASSIVFYKMKMKVHINNKRNSGSDDQQS